MYGVAIIRAGSEHFVDSAALRAAGLKLRAGVSCLPDLILTIQGKTGAFILLPDDNLAAIGRIQEIAKAFSHSFVLAATNDNGQPGTALLGLALRNANFEFLYSPKDVSLTHTALQAHKKILLNYPDQKDLHKAARSTNRALQELQRARKVERSLTSSATRVLLVRHGETAWNAEHRLQGQKDPPLNALGELQARAVAAKLSHSEQWDAIYSSDLKRAAQTAEAIMSSSCATHRPVQELCLTSALRERNLGVLEGLTFGEAVKQESKAWAALCSDQPVPGGESHEDVELRASEELANISRQHQGQTVVVVTHGGVLQVLYKHACGREYSGKFKNCAINCLWIDGEDWKLGIWGDTSHLEGVGVQAEAFGGGHGG